MAPSVKATPFSQIQAELQALGLGAARAHFDFAVDGGAIGVITPKTTQAIPAGAIIIGGYALSSGSVLSGGAATGTVKVGTDAMTGALSIANMAAANVNVMTPTAAAPVLAAGGQITLTVAAFALTAGVMDIMVLYVLPVLP